MRRLDINKDTIRKVGRIAGAAAIFIVVAGVLLHIKHNYDQKQLGKWCSNNLKNEQSLLGKRKWSDANKAANESLSKCNDNLTNADKVVVYKDLAVSSFMLKDKKAAASYAKKGLALNDSITAKEREKIPGQVDVIFTLGDVEDGTYRDVAQPKIQFIKANINTNQ